MLGIREDAMVGAASHPPRIFVTGAIAAGKSFVRETLRDTLFQVGLPVRSLELEDTFADLFPAHETDPNYSYLDDGNLVLHVPHLQIPRAIAELGRRCAEAAQQTGFVVEFGAKDLESSFAFFDEKLLAGAHIFHVHAPRRERVLRNLRRPEGPVLAERIDYYPQNLDASIHAHLKALGSRYIPVVNDGSPEHLASIVKALALRFVAPAQLELSP